MRTKPRLLNSVALACVATCAQAWAQSAPSPAQIAPAAPTSPIAAAPDDAPSDIVVTGIRRSLQSAAQLKRNAPQIVDAIVAEDIGKLPDVSVSDSVARVVGVQVERANGEAGRVLVRGLNLYTTTYDNRDIFTAEVRRVAIQDFPAGGVAAIEVYKTTTPDQIEGGLAGLINVRGRRPFDFKGLEISGGAQGSYDSQTKAYNPDANLLVSNRWQTGIGEVGALVNVSYTELDYTDGARYNGGSTRVAAQPGTPSFNLPSATGIFYSRGDRLRPSVNGGLQWRPNDDLEIYVDGLYQGFRRYVQDRNFNVHLDSGTYSNLQLIPGTNDAQSVSVNGELRPDQFQGATFERTNTYQVGVGGIYQVGNVKAVVDVARTFTKFDQSVYSFDTALSRSTPVNANFNTSKSDGGAEFSLPGFNSRDPSNCPASAPIPGSPGFLPKT